MATGYTKEWIRFFTGCGIPDDVATMYALVFYENRIQKNMLPDLNKEYLRDMGITVMGDVIAILRYAKIVHEKYVREQILSVDDNTDQNNFVNESSPTSKKSTPMKRILEHYTRKYSSSAAESGGEVQVVLPNEKSVTCVPKKMAHRIGPQKNMSFKKIEVSVKRGDFEDKGLEVPVPKVRRVLPENEGGYKIKMPTGTTERSKKLLEQAKKRKIKTVFERLGESSVSSTTSDLSGNSLTISSSSSSAKDKNSSVFSRLGDKTPVVSSTSIDDTDYVTPDQLPYAGILKTNGSNKKNLSNTTMRADDEQQKSEVSKLNSKKGISVKKRLGITKQESQGSNFVMKRLLVKDSIQEQDAKQTRGPILKLANKLKVVESGLKDGGRTSLPKKFNNFRVESAKGTVSTTTQFEKLEARGLKRRLDSDSNEPSPSKKVRFGRTTHRLIPSISSQSESVKNLKNYPKLTMIINNRTKVVENPTLSSGIKIGSLSSDKMRQKVAMKERIGKKSVQGRLGNRIGRLKETPAKKAIHERLG